MESQEWILTEGLCGTPGAEQNRTYGVAVIGADGGVWAWPDVDPDPEVVGVLLERLRRCQPERCHYADMVLDYIEEVAGSPSRPAE